MSHPKKHQVHLTAPERQALQAFVSSGKKQAREITRARLLLLADEGKKDPEIMALLGLSRPTVCSVRKKYAEQSYGQILDMLPDAPRQGRPTKVESGVEAKISMIACSDAPEGAARWTLHMIADQLVKLEIIDSISHESVRQALKKTA